MTSATLTPMLSQRAHEADLGSFVSTLTPSRGSALRTLAVGLALGASVSTLVLTRHPSAWWAVTGLVILGLVGLGFLLVGVVEILPGPGRVLLFERGMLHCGPDGSLDVVRYGSDPDPVRPRSASVAGRHGLGWSDQPLDHIA